MYEPSMETALNPQLRRTRTRGADLLLLHCATIGNCVEEPRLPARERLDAAVGAEFAELLVGALTPGLQNVRRSSSP
jgi:hypothetical protein